MNKNQLVLNMLVFAEKLENHALQSTLIEEAVKLGFEKVEVRREYIKDFQAELPAIKQAAFQHNVELFYSVPDEVFVNNKVNEKLTDYLEEAKQMNVKHIKFNIGNFKTGGQKLTELKTLSDYGIAINIENDQTQLSGVIHAIDNFMKAVKENQLDIGYVYDLGNWRFVGEDEIEAAKKLKDYVRYIHVKDVIYIDNKPQATGLDHGEIDWRKVLTILPDDVPVAIEYPTTKDVEIIESKELLEANIHD
ncbi:sugar phosphate isomerase/epimerase family protein [Enterococcus faecium]|uniref:sugar phosphate isomerase/epimerase family protein n=1 Tax=Enterococcus TaxID=1350 RepID=UPI001898AD5E|nr:MULTISPECIES: sugar phosphate isomerase/epimerase [Enterococcus]MDB7686525.1 sugar phosphate isomerase/epimerase [Enterococcus faecium]MDV5138396.1 sugar phosphate isomerase/epimerase [Enterococcus lactis]